MSFFGPDVRNGVPIGLGSIVSFGRRRAVFSPASLFAAGEQGAWYDPSDTATLFQDSAGVTPVTAVEQPVGLMLDKSKGLVLGTELVTNGAFATDSDWTKGTGWTIGGGVASFSGSPGAELIQTGLSFAANTTYKITFDMTQVSGGGFRFVVDTTGSFVSSYFTTTASHTLVFSVGATSTRFRIAALGGANFSIDNISVRELPGNHAFQTDPAKRPLWSARVNLLTQTEDFANIVWSKTLTITTGVTAPDGTATAFTLTSSAAFQNLLYYVSGLTANVPVKKSIWIRRRTGAGSINFYDVGGYRNVTTSVTTQWSLLDISSAITTTDTYLGVMLSVSGDAVDVWHSDLRVANESNALPPYQRVTTATDYDAGPQWPKYLRFDGDALVTNSVDMSATDELTLFAGIRKLSSSRNSALIIENNTAFDTGDGKFSLFAPATPLGVDPDGFGWFAKGTVRADAVQNNGTTYIGPITTVLTGIADISADVTRYRINAMPNASVSTNLGTGNFGNFAFYIGARAGTSSYYNGRLHSLIVLGRTVTATELTQTEGYVESKTFGKDMNYVYSDELLDPDGEQLLVTAGGDPLFMNVNYE